MDIVGHSANRVALRFLLQVLAYNCDFELHKSAGVQVTYYNFVEQRGEHEPLAELERGNALEAEEVVLVEDQKVLASLKIPAVRVRVVVRPRRREDER